MGSFLGNTFVRISDQQAVCEAITRWLRELPLPKVRPVAFVGPAIGGWVGVYDMTIDRALQLVPDVAERLSRELGAVALTFQLMDGDAFGYTLARNGEVLDTFCSTDDVPGGNPALLAEACCVAAAACGIADLLARVSDDPFDLLDELSQLLGIRNGLVSYSDLCEPVLPVQVEEIDHFLPVLLS